jgi:putative ABC transport system substrate-binding protein
LLNARLNDAPESGPGKRASGGVVDRRPFPPYGAGMDRRRFLLTWLAGAVAAPFAAEAQPAGKIPRIGWLTSSVVHTPNVEAFREGMRTLGYPEVRLEVRAAAGRVDRLSALATELISLNVDVIVTDGGPAATAAKQATAATPIVIGAATTEFLVRQELVGSLARPGGNVTGFTISTGAELYGKRLELLREAMPSLSRILVIWNPSNEGARASLRAIEGAARRSGSRPSRLQLRTSRSSTAVSAAPSGAPLSRCSQLPMPSCGASGRESSLWRLVTAFQGCTRSESSPWRAA